MPKKYRRAVQVSVLITAKDPQELKTKVEELRKQDYPSFEIVATLGGTIAQGYNRAVRKAKGKVLVFTETDVSPISRSWLRQLVQHVRAGEVVKGMELVPTSFNFSNLACFSDVAKRFPLDEGFVVAEDMEWRERLGRHGIRIRNVYDAPVFHLRRPVSTKAYRRAYQYGRAFVRLRRAYDLPEFKSLMENARHQMAIGKETLRGMTDELKARSVRRCIRRFSQR